MSRLDTRGFMDGALRAFDVADRYFQRKDDAQYRRERDTENDRRYNESLNLRHAEETRRQTQFEDLYGVDGQGGALAQDRARQSESHEQTLKLRDAQLANANSAKRRNDYLHQQEQKSVYINENAPLLNAGWQRFMETGETDAVFDDERVKGGAYDPRRYLDPELNHAADVLEANIPKVINGEGDFNDPELKAAFSSFYQSNLKAAVGQKDPKTGKAIKQVRWGGLTFANDIQPELEGEQPGLVITADVMYEGDDEWVARPITQGRSTADDDNVKVIPLEHALQDITGQLKLRRQASLSPTYRSVFHPKGKDTEKDLRKALLDVEKQRSEALKELSIGSTPEQLEAMNQHYDGQAQKVRALFNDEPQMPSSPPTHDIDQWAGNDANKHGFLNALREKGQEVAGVDVATIDLAYKDQINKQKAAKSEQLAGQIRTENAKRYASR
ncbi:hypothetical protein A1OO_08525 [Enterovibrio norvegicus FF-33]|uniref:hypothetical protein n=1 Tax=Enterovibrio norvegicus TaxID=188144 RepID=UPI00036D30B3|nr:hypothetical protein [Enterovibrio norvegicus]OEE65843.1 hypothetical protein A1OO_08525 [Enterovibrio norvegicus FF-33]